MKKIKLKNFNVVHDPADPGGVSVRIVRADREELVVNIFAFDSGDVGVDVIPKLGKQPIRVSAARGGAPMVPLGGSVDTSLGVVLYISKVPPKGEVG